ncbi:ATP-dependent Clp protease ATP-binding subunit ClpX [bacterium HR36]|nr:ATP-dependent Clp protease ATP-binding subunit ClpX [bacterium HR36]
MFTDAALHEIARRAKEKDTGVRGLRAIVDELMMDIMFHLPDLEHKGRFVVTEKVVRGEEPLFDKSLLGQRKTA